MEASETAHRMIEEMRISNEYQKKEICDLEKLEMKCMKN